MTATDCEHHDDDAAVDEDDAPSDGYDDAPETQEEGNSDDERDVDAHLRDVEAGAGCTEIWEHLSETRDD